MDARKPIRSVLRDARQRERERRHRPTVSWQAHGSFIGVVSLQAGRQAGRQVVVLSGGSPGKYGPIASCAALRERCPF
eukprot:COSAG06_NODE_41203_length_393_cov_7.306122_1_plen_77_part_01